MPKENGDTMSGSELFVYFENALVGRIQEKGGELSFVPSAPSENKFSGLTSKNIHDFMDNLLSEGKRRKFYANSCKLDEKDVFGLISRFGEDLSGAFQFLPEKKTASVSGNSATRNVTEEIEARIENRESLELLPGQKMSLCGIDNKTAVHMCAGQMYMPCDDFPSTHIIKSSRSLSGNEWFISFLAESCGIRTITPFLKAFGDEEALVSRRYDRVYADGKVQRLHQEDFCQMLGKSPEDKYCNGRKGVSNADICGILDTLPGEDKDAFLKIAAFSLLVGNNDDHAKNYAVVYYPEGPRLSPAYDLVSFFGAKRLTREWSGVDTTLSRPFGKTLDPYRIKDKDFILYAETMKVDPDEYLDMFIFLAGRIGEVLPEVLDASRNFLKEENFSPEAATRLEKTFQGLNDIIPGRLDFFVKQAKRAEELVIKSDGEPAPAI